MFRPTTGNHSLFKLNYHMRLLLTVIIVLYFPTTSLCQVFAITDYNTSGCPFDAKTQSRNTAQLLGSKVVIEIFDTKIKVSSDTNDPNKASVHDKVDDTTYKSIIQKIDGPSTFTIKLVKTLGYINSIQIIHTGYVNQDKICKQTMTAKRL